MTNNGLSAKIVKKLLSFYLSTNWSGSYPN